MKVLNVFAALAVCAAAVACNGNAPKAVVAEDGTVVKSAKDYLPSKAQKDSVSYLLGVNFGSFIKAYNFGGDLNYSKMVDGIKDMLAAKGDQRSPEFAKQFDIDPNTLNAAFNAYLDLRNNYTSAKNKEDAAKFLEANKKKAGVQVTESGLQYEILEPGNDLRAKDVDTVYVHYKGTLSDGTVFDEVSADEEPLALNLGNVIAGWKEGLKLIGEGGKVKLVIPSELGYGENGAGAIPPSAPLVFDVELVKIGAAPDAE